jgi:adenosylcobinamide-GDP ribazoletransferase
MTRPLLIALQFLTRLPVPLRDNPTEGDTGRSLLYYPLVGLALGLLLAATAWALADAPALLRAALVLTAWVLLTGALHLDGLSDSADAWAGGHGDRDRTLAIMKDPNCGPVGVVVLVMVLLVKLAALESIASSREWTTLLLIPVLGRTALPLLFLTTPYVRPGGLGAVPAQYQRRRASALVVLLTVIAVLLSLGATGLWLLLASAGVFLMLRALMIQRIGGTTGDTAGALVELLETAGLVTAALVHG